MKRKLYTFLFILILQCLNIASSYGQSSLFSQKRENVKINSQHQPDSNNNTSKKAAIPSLKSQNNSINPYITLSTDQLTIGPTNGDTASFFVLSNINWRVIDSLGWITTNPAWVSITGDKKVSITLNTQWFTIEDLTGEDKHGVFTIEEDSQSPTRIIKTINVTLKSYPGILTTPIHSITFTAVESKTYSITSNLPWSAEKKTSANWLNVTPSFSLSGTVNLKIDCITTNAGSRDNSVYLMLKQSKGVVKDSILVIQQGSHVGVKDYEMSGIKIYPQPAGEILNIDLPDNNEMKYWNIYNQVGAELMKGSVGNKNKLQIPLNRLSSGVYFIDFRSDTQNIGLKFTK